MLDVAQEVEEDGRLASDHPGIVAGRNVEDIVRLELGVLAIVHLDREPPRQQELQVVNLAERLVDLPQHVGRPSPARPNPTQADGQGTDSEDVHG